MPAGTQKTSASPIAGETQALGSRPPLDGEDDSFALANCKIAAATSKPPVYRLPRRSTGAAFAALQSFRSHRQIVIFRRAGRGCQSYSLSRELGLTGGRTAISFPSRAAERGP